MSAARGPRYPVGRKAWAICQRSGRRLLYRDLVEDGYLPGLLVAPEWYEPKHPQEFPIDTSDSIALWRPAPDLDKAVASTSPITPLSASWSPAPQNESIARGAQSTTTYTLTASNGYGQYQYLFSTNSTQVGIVHTGSTANAIKLLARTQATPATYTIVVTGIAIDAIDTSAVQTFSVQITVT